MFFWGRFLFVHTDIPQLDSAPKYSGVSISSIALSSQIGVNYDAVPSSDNAATSLGISSGIGSDSKSQQTFFDYYFEILRSYESVASLDIVERVAQSSNKTLVLNSYIDQLDFQYDRSIGVISNFQKESLSIQSSLTNINLKISELHGQIQQSFFSKSSDAVVRQNHEIESLRSREQFLRARLVFLQAFIVQFQSLNDFSNLKKQAISLNKQAIVSGVQVTIPNSSAAYLEELGIVRFTDS